MPKVFIGTSGWLYKDWQPKFYPKDLASERFLDYYTKIFNSVEINRTFYQDIDKQIAQRWREIARTNNPDFIFSAKVPRAVTHIFRFNARAWKIFERFMSGLEGLGDSLVAILFQLPLDFKKNLGILRALPDKAKTRHVGYVIEFRNPSWYDDEVFEMCKQFSLTIAFIDSPVHSFSEDPLTTKDLAYFRFHGRKNWYDHDYSASELLSFAEAIKRLQRQAKVCVYFNNTANAYAAQNALQLKQYLV